MKAYPSYYKTARDLRTGEYFAVQGQDTASKDTTQHLLLRRGGRNLWVATKYLAPCL